MSGIFDQIINYSPPLIVSGTVNYDGTWDASTNTPTLNNPPAASTKGDYYVVSVAGTQFSITFAVGDWIISNGTAWEKVDLTDAVSSVFGRTGAVVGVSTDYSAVGITNTAVGAANPSTGAFTTVTASSTIAATGAVSGSNLSGTNTGDQTITLTGGVTGSGTGSFAATVVTNANLTGVITSVGNATSIASQTGTGTTFVVSGSPTITTPVIAQINDASGNETLKLASIASAVNEVTIENAATGNAVHISATGGDASVGLHLAGKGASGYVNVQDSTDATKRIMFNAAGGTTNTRTMLSSTQTVDRTISLPDATDTLVGRATTDTLTNKTLTSATLTTPVLGTPSSGTLTSCTGLPISTGVSGLGTGIATALAVNTGSAGAPVLFNGALGTPSSGTVTNLTGTASININGTVGASTPNTVAATTLSASGASTFTNSAPSVIGGLGFRNRIINGDMRIDQRNEGASVTASGSFPVDRWTMPYSATGLVLTAQRSTTAPTGFLNSTLITASTGASSGAGETVLIRQNCEGQNTPDFLFGTANAKTITVSFWVRSSLTGTYCATIKNSAQDRAYVAEYTINAANTFEYKTITVAGDTSGTWLNTNGIGVRVEFDLGSGTTFNATANVWTASNVRRTTNQVNWCGTTGRTFYLTGVQLEVGNAATEFERRPFGQELALCQRYYEKSYDQGTALATSTATGLRNFYATGILNNYKFASIPFSVSKRAASTVVIYSRSGLVGSVSDGDEANYLAASAANVGTGSFQVLNSSGSTMTPSGGIMSLHFAASAEP